MSLNEILNQIALERIPGKKGCYGKEYDGLQGKEHILSEKLKNNLPKESVQLFNEISNTSCDMGAIMEEVSYKLGFADGIRFLLVTVIEWMPRG
ncbi:hypothetical protein RT761_01421 [Atribacter laminatus]|uniref:Uncharacterized protein n=2 Tax=Atribacter laminatus TaxID=2847778 RepID=A0A7T1F3B5_ATRLM|nr:hypothetical protein RT761_01421 [Atribacter laminatus]